MVGWPGCLAVVPAGPWVSHYAATPLPPGLPATEWYALMEASAGTSGRRRVIGQGKKRCCWTRKELFSWRMSVFTLPVSSISNQSASNSPRGYFSREIYFFEGLSLTSYLPSPSSRTGLPNPPLKFPGLAPIAALCQPVASTVFYAATPGTYERK